MNCAVIIFNIFCYIIIRINCNEYENEDKMYLVVSPDQHTHTPRLEDFFWTGSGDGPPPPEPPQAAPIEPSTPIIKTTTVLATVYLDSYPPQAVTDITTGDCVLNCGEDAITGSLSPDIPEDRRYWLLTVIQGSTPDSLQLKLARLYQKAFLRQQERHLGIIKSLDAPTSRKKHDVHSFVVNKENNLNQRNTNSHITSPLRYLDIQSSMVNRADVLPTRIPLNGTNYIENDLLKDIARLYKDNHNLTFKDFEIKPTKTAATWILATPIAIEKREVDLEELVGEDKEELIEPLEEDVSNETMLFKREIIKPEQQPPVQVHIQNITETPETGTVQIVYVVLVGGRAVPAAVAARDMRLVRDAEVATELGATVTTKAEPYLKAAAELSGESSSGVVRGTELWALIVGASGGGLLVVVLLVLLCLAHRRKAKRSAASLRAYRNELMREAQRHQLKQVHEEKDGKLISVVSPSRTRPSSTLLPVYRASSVSGSSTSSSGVSEMAAALRRRQKKPHALKMPQKKRVGTTDSLLEAAGLDSSDSSQSARPSAPVTPTSYLSMPSVNSFPRCGAHSSSSQRKREPASVRLLDNTVLERRRSLEGKWLHSWGNLVEPLSRILEPVSVRHLDIDSPVSSPKDGVRKEVIPRRQMASQLVRLGSLDKDPGVIGPLVWDLHCQRIKDATKPTTPLSATPSRSRQRFNELKEDAESLFKGSAPDTYIVRDERRGAEPIAQARNENVRLPGSPYTALDTIRGRSAGPGRSGTTEGDSSRPRTSLTKTGLDRRPPARAWGPTPPQSLTSRFPTPHINPAIILAEGKLTQDDPAIPIISAIKSEIQRIREGARK